MRLLLAVLPLAVITSPAWAADGSSIPVPKTEPSGWIEPSDYPPSALREDADGVVGFALSVDVKGVPTSCEVTQSSGRDDLDDTACRLVMERARFEPARDPEGRPVQGLFSSRIKWLLNDARPVPVAMLLQATMVIEQDGTVSSCTVDKAEGAASGLGMRMCDKVGPFTPPTDADGNPVRKRVRSTMQITQEDLES